MGMYTGLRFDAKLNETGKKVVGLLLEQRYGRDKWEGVIDEWRGVADEYPELGYLKEWSSVGRSNFIPFGAVCYLPWHYNNELVNGTWSVTCSLKNYEREIEYFLENVFPHLIAEPTRVQVWYEEWRGPEVETIEPYRE